MQNKYLKKSLSFFLICMCAVGVMMRLTNLITNPPGFYVDEASIAENAYQIMTNGTDEWQVPYPVYFKAFGEYKNPLFIYSLALSFKLFGVSIETTRGTAAFWGLATVGMIGLLAESITRRTEWRYLGILISLFYPWHFYTSRIAFEAITLPFFMATTLYTLTKYLQKHDFTYLWSSVMSTALMFYSYTSARFLSPLIFICLLYYAGKKHVSKVPHLILLYIVLLLPAIAWNSVEKGSLLARYQQVKTTNITQIAITYFRQFDPVLWLGSGDTNLHHTAQKGLMTITYFPFFLLGMMKIIKKWRLPNNAILLLLVATAPIPASLTNTDPNALRMIHLIPIVISIITIGIHSLYTTPFRLKKILLTLLTCATIGEHAYFFYTFEHTFKNTASYWFDAPFVALIPKLNNTNDPVWIHHYLFNNSHQVTYAFLCHVAKNCLPKELHFSENATTYIEGATNIYFGADCQVIQNEKSVKVIDNNSEYCIYQ